MAMIILILKLNILLTNDKKYKFVMKTIVNIILLNKGRVYMSARKPWWQNRFHDLGMRITEPRRLVMEVLTGTKDHFSATDIYMKAHANNPAIGLTTVYRTLEILRQMGIVQKFEFGEGKSRYELINSTGSRDHHHHLVCVHCKNIVNYYEFIEEELEFIDKTQRKLSKKYNFQINDHIINFLGLCEQCKDASPI
jgi:Fur family ferric uptake transcriptional regulator